VINSSDNLTDPGSGTTYVSESTWTGTIQTVNSGTTILDYYTIQYLGGGLGVTTNGSGDPQSLVTLAGGATQFVVNIPETSLSITVGTISATTNYPPDPPTGPNETYSDRYSVPRSATGTWYLELWNSAGTTKVAEAEIVGASHYRQGGYSYTYYYAGSTPPYTWSGPSSLSVAASYTGNIPAGYKGGTVIVPSTGTYKVRLAYKLAVASGQLVDYNAGDTYYANSATPSHAETGFINYLNFSFTPNKNKTEITNGGIQVINNTNAYFKINRIEPSSYGFSSYIVQSRGGIHDLGGGGTTINQIWNNTALNVDGRGVIVGALLVGGGAPSVVLDETMFKVDGDNTRFAKFAVNVIPNSNNAYSLGNSSNKWTQVWATTGTIQTSDITEKTNIENSILGLDFINRLNPVSYKYISGSAIYEESEITSITKTIKEEVRSEDGTIIEPAEYKEVPNPDFKKIVGWNPGVRKHYGLIAQEVKTVLDDLNVPTKDFAGYIEGDLENHKNLGLRYEEFIAPMIKSIQELSQKVLDLEAKISGSL